MKRAPGAIWRGPKVERPWAWSQINGGQDLPAQVSGLCQGRYHDDCPQAPRHTSAGPGQCACPCHRSAP